MPPKPLSNARFFIVLPVRNGGIYLPQAVQSVVDQTCSNWHLVILENGSNDGTAQWLSTLHDPRITVYAAQQNLSIEANWGRVLDVPCGEFLTLLGHDDLFDPWYLEEMEQLIEQEPEASLYQTQFRLIDASGKPLRAASFQPQRETADEFLQSRLQCRRESFGTGYMMRWRDYVGVGGMPNYPGLIFADDALWIQLMRLSFKATSPKECFSYRVHAISSSASASGETHLQAMERYLEFLKNLTTKDENIGQILHRHRDYFLWHAHQAYAIDLTQATKNNRRIDTPTINRFNDLLISLDASWSLQTNQTRSLRMRQIINHFSISRFFYNLQHKMRYGS